jgi:2-polyprenyl-3-methyl-5-hydroxy-6-metoxy-1,4-benzoquinol methylase
MNAHTPDARESADIETASAEYARRFSGAVGAWFLDVQAAATLELAAPWQGRGVLDVGGGHGQLTGPLAAAGFDVTVLGSAPSCRERVAAWVDADRARFQVGDLLHVPWPARSFDVVLAFRLLPHVARWRDLVAELCRVARHAVIVDYPTRRSVNAFARLLFRLKRRVESDTRPFDVFKDEDVTEGFSANGFAVTGRCAQFFLPMALHRGLGSASVSRASERVARALGLTRVLGSPVIVRATRRA